LPAAFSPPSPIASASRGAPGDPGVAWGDWPHFLDDILLDDVATLNSFAPKAAIPTLGWIATIAEVVFAAGLLIGWRLHIVALLSALLLLSFALTMTFSVGVKAPLDYSVFTAAAAAFALAAMSPRQPRTAPLSAARNIFSIRS
jgi:hypothetical protein